jgi:hypothetical protein
MWPTPARGRARRAGDAEVGPPSATAGAATRGNVADPGPGAGPANGRCRGRAALGHNRGSHARQCGRPRPGVGPRRAGDAEVGPPSATARAATHAMWPTTARGRARRAGEAGVGPPSATAGAATHAMWPTPARGRARRAGDAGVGPPSATAGAAMHAMWPTPARGRARRAGDAGVGPPSATAGAATHAMWPTTARGRVRRAGRAEVGPPSATAGAATHAMWPTPARGRARRAGEAGVGPPSATAGAATHAMWPTPARGRVRRAGEAGVGPPSATAGAATHAMWPTPARGRAPASEREKPGSGVPSPEWCCELPSWTTSLGCVLSLHLSLRPSGKRFAPAAARPYTCLLPRIARIAASSPLHMERRAISLPRSLFRASLTPTALAGLLPAAELPQKIAPTDPCLHHRGLRQRGRLQEGHRRGADGKGRHPPACRGAAGPGLEERLRRRPAPQRQDPPAQGRRDRRRTSHCVGVVTA